MRIAEVLVCRLMRSREISASLGYVAGRMVSRLRRWCPVDLPRIDVRLPIWVRRRLLLMLLAAGVIDIKLEVQNCAIF